MQTAQYTHEQQTYVAPHLLAPAVLQLLEQKARCIHIKESIAYVLVPGYPHHLAQPSKIDVSIQ